MGKTVDAVFKTLKNGIIGRITDDDINLIQDGLKRLADAHIYDFKFNNDYAHIFYYMRWIGADAFQNRFFVKLKETLDNSKAYVFGSTTYKTRYKEYFKYFRFYPDYDVIELVSDYYNKIPLYIHFSKFYSPFEDELYDKIDV